MRALFLNILKKNKTGFYNFKSDFFDYVSINKTL